MTWMNEYEIDEAHHEFRNDPVLGPATRSLANFVAVVNRNSDGWPYWQAPAKAAAKLMILINNARGASRRDWPPTAEATAADVKRAYTPIRSFLTRHKLSCELIVPGEEPPEQHYQIVVTRDFTGTEAERDLLVRDLERIGTVTCEEYAR